MLYIRGRDSTRVYQTEIAAWHSSCFFGSAFCSGNTSEAGIRFFVARANGGNKKNEKRQKNIEKQPRQRWPRCKDWRASFSHVLHVLPIGRRKFHPTLNSAELLVYIYMVLVWKGQDGAVDLWIQCPPRQRPQCPAQRTLRSLQRGWPQRIGLVKSNLRQFEFGPLYRLASTTFLTTICDDL